MKQPGKSPRYSAKQRRLEQEMDDHLQRYAGGMSRSDLLAALSYES